jgi:3-hydroxyacyl-CoA dehydrogenase / 3-hydroxy-2-methylbutyryl-CoA dehydrogenase
MEIKNSVAVISGGASGLGEASVRRLVANGAKAAILDLDEKRGNGLVEELGNSTRFFKTDVTDGQSVQNAVNGAFEDFGAIHVAISCAGIGTPMKVIGKNGPMPIDQFNQVIQVNLIGTMNVIRLAAEKMFANEPNEDGEKGVVINTASVAAFEGQIGQAAYASSKAAVAGLTLPIAREFANYGIRVVTIAPGLFETPMLAALPEKALVALSQMMPFPKRLGYPTEYAMLVEQILSNPMLNGETIRLDAALRMSG